MFRDVTRPARDSSLKSPTLKSQASGIHGIVRTCAREASPLSSCSCIVDECRIARVTHFDRQLCSRFHRSRATGLPPGRRDETERRIPKRWCVPRSASRRRMRVRRTYRRVNTDRMQSVRRPRRSSTSAGGVGGEYAARRATRRSATRDRNPFLVKEESCAELFRVLQALRTLN